VKRLWSTPKARGVGLSQDRLRQHLIDDAVPYLNHVDPCSELDQPNQSSSGKSLSNVLITTLWAVQEAALSHLRFSAAVEPGV
jgi:hypothetical protein